MSKKEDHTKKQLALLSTEREVLVKAVKANRDRIMSMDTRTHMLTKSGDGELNTGIDIHNLRRNSESICIYLDMLTMLLEHMGEDIENIKRKLNLQELSVELAQKEADKKKADADRMREKRMQI